jgi:Mitochondrial ATP synthase epsilon chain
MAVRGAMKEPAKRKVLGQETFSYNVSTWQNGIQSGKSPVVNLAAAGK